MLLGSLFKETLHSSYPFLLSWYLYLYKVHITCTLLFFVSWHVCLVFPVVHLPAISQQTASSCGRGKRVGLAFTWVDHVTANIGRIQRLKSTMWTFSGSLISQHWSVSPCLQAPSYMRSRGYLRCGNGTTQMEAYWSSIDNVIHHFTEETKVQRGWVTWSGTQKSRI